MHWLVSCALDFGIESAVKRAHLKLQGGEACRRRTFVSRWRNQEAFQSAGIDRPLFLTDLRFVAGGWKTTSLFSSG